jgi:hypothetical protein
MAIVACIVKCRAYDKSVLTRVFTQKTGLPMQNQIPSECFTPVIRALCAVHHICLGLLILTTRNTVYERVEFSMTARISYSFVGLCIHKMLMPLSCKQHTSILVLACTELLQLLVLFTVYKSFARIGLLLTE